MQCLGFRLENIQSDVQSDSGELDTGPSILMLCLKLLRS